MAFNEFIVPERYEDLTPAPQVDQATLNRMALRSFFLQSSFNYETMQSGGWLFAMLPGLEKVHTNRRDLAVSMYHNLDFINTHPFLVTFVMGIVLSLEQNKVDIQTIRAVRISAASPLGGIGDALFWLTLVPITAGITSNMAIQGNALAPSGEAEDITRQNLMKMAAPAGVATRFFSLQKTIDVIGKATAKQKIFIVVETPTDALALVKGGVPIRKLNIGNMHMSEGKRQVATSVAVDDADVAAFRELQEMGVELEIRRVPSTPVEDTGKLFA